MADNEAALIREGVVSTWYIILTQGPLLTALSLFFGLDVFTLAVLTAVPLILQVFQLITPHLIDLLQNRKALLIGANGTRVVWIIVIVSLLLGHRDALLFSLIFCLSQAANAVAGNTWMSMVRDLVSDEHRSSFVAKRNAYISAATVLLMLGYSWVLERAPEPVGVILVITIGLAASAVGIVLLRPVRDVPWKRDRSRKPIATVLREPAFRALCLAFACWNGVVMLTAPFFPYHMLENLEIPLTVVGAHAVAVSLLSILFYAGWGIVAGRYGSKTILVAGMAVVSLTPGLWLFMNEDAWLVPLALDAIFAALGWAAVNTAFISLPLDVAEDASPSYFGLYFASGGVGGLVGSLVGGGIASLLSTWRFELFSVTLFGVQTLFLLGVILRLACIPLFARIATQRYTPPWEFAFNALASIARRSPLRVFESMRPEVGDKE